VATPGFVYILSHPCWNNLRYPVGAPGVGAVKIGRTGRDPRTRLAEITSASGLIHPGRVEHVVWVADMRAVEAAIQRDLGRYRIKRRELFRVDVDTAVQAIEACAGVIALGPIERPALILSRRRWRYRRLGHRQIWKRCIMAGGVMALAVVLMLCHG
jgi:hypothetical protein